MSQALAWRLHRHYLDAGAGSVADVVQRLGAVPAWSGEPNLAVQRRLKRPRPDAIADALNNGDLIRTYAFRGTTHLMTAEDAGVYLAVRGANRQWELPSWQKHYDLRAQDWPVLREAVREALSDGPVSRVELIDAITANPCFRHLRQGLGDPSHTLLKPFAWQGTCALGRSAMDSPRISHRM